MAREASRPRVEGARSRFARALEKRLLRFIQGQGVLQPGERVLVAVSGGPDSTALLLLLANLREALGLQLAVAHFDHQLRRPEEGAADAAYVRHLVEALGLTVTYGKGDVRKYARSQGISLEEAGRQLRYAFLAQEARRLVAGVVAVGHTASDQAETVLLHVIRGSGLDGLVGMRPRGAWPLGQGPALARPLLEVWRAETERYCQELGLRPRQDPTNLLLEATRNRVRHQLLPLLRELNPAVEESLLRLATASASYIDYLEKQADALWRTLAQEAARSIGFPRQELAALAPAMATRLLRRAARQLLGPGADLEAVHLQAMLAGLSKGRTRLSLPRGLRFMVRGSRALLTLEEEKLRGGPAPMPPMSLAVPGRARLPQWTVEARLISRPKEIRPDSPWEAYLDAEAVGTHLLVRSRRPGDRLRPLGLGGEKKVQDLLVDAKVAVEERDGVPIVCARWGVVWVVGHRIDERAAVGVGTRRVLHLRFEANAGPERA